MAGGGGKLTRYHTWGLLVPIICALSPVWISKHPISGVHPAFNAVIYGALVGALAYLAMTMLPKLREEHALSKAALLGLLVAEILVLQSAWKSGTGTGIPKMATITLYLFFYFNTVENH